MPANKLRGRRKLGYTFIRLNLNLESVRFKPSAEIFTEALDTALTTFYGIVGGALNWDLVEFEKDNCIAIVRCLKSDEERIWAASSFMTQVKGTPCRLQVLEASPTLVPASDLDADLVESSI